MSWTKTDYIPPPKVEYNMIEVEKISKKARVPEQRVLHLISKRGKTTYLKLAEMVSALTGEPLDTYLTAKAPKIDPVEVGESYKMTRIPASEMNLEDFSDLELFQFLSEVRVLASDIVREMRRRLEGKQPSNRLEDSRIVP